MGASELRVVVRATQMSVGSPAGHVVTLMVSLSPIHRPVMALHMQPVYTVLLGHGQRGLLGGPVPVPVAPVHAHKSDLWLPIRFNDTEEDREYRRPAPPHSRCAERARAAREAQRKDGVVDCWW